MNKAELSDVGVNTRSDGARPLLEIDAQTCVACGLCVRVCPTLYLTQNAPKKRPEGKPDGRCLRCGHCAAVCPKGAIVHTRMDMDAFQPISGDWDADSVEMLLRAKRTVRRFKDKPVPREIIERLLNIAVCAPTNSNSQDRAFLVLTDREYINTLESLIIDTFRVWMENELEKGRDSDSYLFVSAKAFVAAHEHGHHPVFHDAPCVICVHSHENNYFGPHNCILAADYLMLYAHALGLGSCVIGAALHSPKETGHFLGLANDRRLQSVIALGHPDVRFKRTVSRRPARVRRHNR